jgi:hypothetical protein
MRDKDEEECNMQKKKKRGQIDATRWLLNL